MNLTINNNVNKPNFNGTFQILDDRINTVGKYSEELCQKVYDIASNNKMGKIKPGQFDCDELHLYGTGENDENVKKELSKIGVGFLYTEKTALLVRRVKDVFNEFNFSIKTVPQDKDSTIISGNYF